MLEQDNKNTVESGFKVNSLVLIKSDFYRVKTVTFNDINIKNNIEINVIVQTEGNFIYVTEILIYTQIFNEVEEVRCSIEMVGLFEKIGESLIKDLEQFGKINGPAIIFPYIREHLSNLALKAGLGLIILPPTNFTKL